MFQTILLAVDGLEHSTKAAMLAGKLAQESKGEVIAYNLLERIPTRFSAVPSYADEEANIADDVANRLKADGVSVRPEREIAFHGQAAQRIVEKAKESHADVIMMGSRGLSDIGGLFLGSVAHKVLHLADRPVLIVK